MSAPPPPADLPGFGDGSVFRTLFAAYPDALLVVEPGGDIVLANPAAADLLGYTTDELVGLPVDALVPESIRPRHAAYRAGYAQTPRSRPMGTQMDLVARRRDGSEVMVEIALSPLQPHGLPYVVAAIRGVGAYPRVRQALQRARYSEQVAALGRLAVDARDPQQLIAQVPRSAAETLEVEQAAVWLLDEQGLEWRVAASAGDGARDGQRRPHRPDTWPGRLMADARTQVVVDADGSTLAVPLGDRGRTVGALLVGSRRPDRFGDDELRFAEALASLLSTTLQRTHTEHALQHSQRLESVGQLTGGIAHDFNNLLTIISGNLQVLDELPAVADDDYARQLLTSAVRATRRGAELTAKLLAFSRRQVLQPSRVDVGAMLGSLADMLKRTLDQRIRIEVDVAAGCPPGVADPGQLESALLNIAINARDAMPDGGTLRFRALPVGELPADAEGDGGTGFVAIEVRDSGSGMPDAVKQRAFEPFFTTKESGRGTGLGLSTVYGFARQSRGAVTLDSAPGAGTTVTLFIPAATDARARTPAEHPAAAATLPPGLRVLLVEDDAEVRGVAQRHLAVLGCEVQPCANAEQALARLEAGAAVDLLLSDVALGAGMRGTELAERASALRPGLPVLLVSGFSTELLEPAGADALAWELLPKPYTRETLAAAMARALV